MGTPERATLFCKIEKVGDSSNINEESDSVIGKDEKKKEDEEKAKQLEREKAERLRELKRNDTKKGSKDWIDRLKEFFEYLWKNPQKLILYILIFVTIIIYIVIFTKKIKEKKNGKKRRNQKIKSNNNKSNIKNLNTGITRSSNKNTNSKKERKVVANPKSVDIFNSKVEEENIARIKEILSMNEFENSNYSKNIENNSKIKKSSKNSKHTKILNKNRGKHSK